MFGKLIGSIIAAPIRIVNAPLSIIDRAAGALVEDRDQDERTISAAGEITANAVERTVSEIFGD